MWHNVFIVSIVLKLLTDGRWWCCCDHFQFLCTILNDGMMCTFLFGWLMPLCCSGNVHFSNFLWQNVVNLHRPFLHLSFFLAALLLLYFPLLTYSVVGAIFCLWIVQFEMHEMWISCGSHNKFWLAMVVWWHFWDRICNPSFLPS